MKSICDNCEWIGQPAVALSDIKKLSERIEPGAVVPSGECPRCGALCYPSHDDGGRSLPPDPDGMNDKRAAWAFEAVRTMAELTNCDLKEDAPGDLMCNIMHWCDRSGISFDVLLEGARSNYAEETREEPDEEASPAPACIITGAPGEDPEDCTTHAHEVLDDDKVLSGPWTVSCFETPQEYEDPLVVFVVTEIRDHLAALYESMDGMEPDSDEEEKVLERITAVSEAVRCRIAAAPEMLGALMSMIQAVESMTGMLSAEPSPFLSDHGKKAWEAARRARAVIARVKGGEA